MWRLPFGERWFWFTPALSSYAEVGSECKCSGEDSSSVTAQCLRTNFDGLSPFCPCGRDLAEFFKSTG